MKTSDYKGYTILIKDTLPNKESANILKDGKKVSCLWCMGHHFKKGEALAQIMTDIDNDDLMKYRRMKHFTCYIKT